MNMLHSLNSMFALVGLLTWCASPFTSQAQTFQRAYGGSSFDQGFDVVTLADGGSLVTGSTTSSGPGTENLLVMRTDALGNPVWSNTYGGQFNEVGTRARVHPDGGFVVLGHTDNSWGNLRSLYLLRLNDDGSLLWSRRVGSSGNDDATDFLILSDGGYLLTGNSGTLGSRRLLLVRLDANGDLVWVQQPGSSGFDGGFSLAPASDGGFLVVGTTENLGPGQRDFFVIRYDAAGTQQWVRTYGGSGLEQALSAQPTDDGGWIIAGSTTTFGSGNQSILVLRIDDLGAVQWTKAYGGQRSDIVRRIVPAHGSGHILVGGLQSTPGASRDHGLLMHIDDDGDVMWANTYGAGGQESGLHGVALVPNGYVATGYRSEPATVFDLLLMRTDLVGQSGCDQESLDMPASDVTLAVTTPMPLNSTIGITTFDPPTQTGAGLPVLETYCLDMSTGIDSAPTTTSIRVFPNPAQDHLWVETAMVNPMLRLFDAHGRVALEARVVNGVLDVRGLAPGLYTGQFIGNGLVEHFRFLKE